MAASLVSQLQAIKSIVQADSEPLKRPFTRPSILFSPKEAADIDIDAIYDIALTGLEVLVKTDERFRSYRNDLFSHRSKELDRELMSAEENDRINVSITSYLRLLSGYFQCPSGLKTLEYLIRRYKIHAYNMEELILCALPYHDTHGFVRIVQLLNFGNTKWKFLEGVKVSGAPPPRQILVQQCIRDMGVLEVLCSYASPSKKFQPSSTVVTFCTAVVVEVVGCLATVDSDVVKRILPFVVSTIQSGVKGGSECKASALMIVSLLAKKAALSPKLVKSLIRSIAEIAQEYKKDAMELQWVRLSFMALINLVQSQLVDVFPKKVVDVMKETRDITGILAQLSSDFSVDKFLALLLESLVEYSFSDASCRFLLLSIIEKVPIGNVVDHLISKVLFSCMKLSQKIDDSVSESGLWARKILVGIMKSYPSELNVAVRKFLENPRLHSGKQEPVIETLSRVLDGNFGSSLPMLDSKIWFSLHHPKAEVRCAALSSLNVSGVLKANMDRSQGLETIHDAILQQLHDNDLSVVRAALSVNELPDLVNDNDFLQVLRAIMLRCVGILVSGSSNNILLAGDTFMLCLKFFITRSQGSLDLSKALAASIFPLLLTMPKTQKYTLRVLELAKEVNWPLYQNLPSPPDSETKLQAGSISSINLSVVDSLADQFLKQPQEFLPFLVERSNDFIVSKTLFLLVLLQSIMMAKKGNRVLDLLEACLPVVQTQWETFKFDDDIHVEECNMETLGRDCIGFLDQLFDAKFEELNRKILLSIFWRFLGAFISAAPADLLPNEGVRWVGKLREIFILFARFNRRQLFREHLHYLVTNCKICPATYLSGFFTEEGLPVAVQVESLRSFEYLCGQSEDGLSFQLLAKFPSLLVPMASDNKDIRNAAMGCIEGLHTLCTHVGVFGKKNGTVALWSHFLDGLLTLIIQHKRLILSDRKFLASFLSALVVPSGAAENFLVPQDVRNRFSQSTKKEILDFILESALKLSSYGKLVILSLLRGTGEALMHVKDVEILLSKLLEIRDHCYFEMDSSCQRLSKTEVDILSLLLESCAKSSAGSFNFAHHLLKALHPLVCSFSNASPKKRLATLITVVFNGSMVGGSFSEDPAVVLPCITVLRKLNNQIYVGLTSEMQELLFLALVFLFRRGNAEIQNATKEALLSLDVPGSTMAQMLFHLSQFEFPLTPQRKKRRSSSYCSHEQDVLSKGEDAFSFLSSVLDILLLKKDIANRESLLGPLFKLLGCIFSDKWIHGDSYLDGSPIQAVSAISGTATSELHHIQQKLLLVVEDIVASFADHMQNKGQMMDSINIKLLINCAHSAKDGVTCNHIFSLLSRITRVIPDRILNHMKDILTVAGEISLTQVDSDSQRVFEELISSIVPCWLSKTNNVDPLLEVFVNVLPEVAEKRRLSAVIYLLRILGESSGLASLLFLLFRSLIARKSLLEPDSDEYNSLEFMGVIQMEWEYKFALQIFEHYPCRAWLPSIVMLLKQIGRESPNQVMFVELLFAMHFTSGKLQDPEFAFALESRGDLENIQGMLEELMEQVVYLWQLIDSKRGSTAPAFVREGLKYYMNSVMTTTTMVMIPSSYFKGITKILDNADQSVKRKALSLLCKTMKHQGSLPLKRKEKREYSLTMHSNWLQLDEGALEAFDIMCMGIVQLLDMSEEDSNTSLKSAAVSALGVLANRFPSNRSMFNGCLNAVVGTIGSSDVALSSCSLQTAGTLISVLGAKALIHLPHLMENMMKLWGSISSGLNVESKVVENDASFKSSISRDLMLSVLIALEAVLDKLGGFLNPYLENICKFLVLHPDLALGSDVKLKSEADTARKLIADKIPVRLALPPLVNLYSGAVAAGNPSLTIMFEMLTKMITTMDRASIAGYHTRIFDLCLSALDLRRQHNPSIKNINAVERSVINTMIGLTMKLTEGMFKPLFIRVIEWAESDVEGIPYIESRNLDRAISFYELVNKLAENHRSLFVPYFKYMLESCVRHLTDTEEGPSGLVQKKKKAKTSKIKFKEGNNELSLEKWRTRALVLSALHKCFLYDTGFSKFLDPSTFQVLLKPIVSQLVVEPPPSLEDHTDVPSVQEVDDLLVLCTGQMAVTAGSDLLCKPLNHEVLMQTRSEKVRPRILGLKIVKYLLKNLKEEYLVFLAETIPFLGELLEDVELPVKSLAQEILKEMESMSGESLRQYL